MKKHLWPALASALMLTACANAPVQPVADSLTANPFFAESTLPYKLPPFERIGDGDYLPAFEAGMAQQREQVRAIADSAELPTVVNTLEALERSGQLLDRVSKVFFNLTASNTNPQMQKVQSEIAPKLSAHNDAILLDGRLFARIASIYDRRQSLGLDAETLRLVERYQENFVRAGARLPEEGKTRLRAINQELSKATTQFQQNLLKENNAAAIVVERLEDLVGLTPGEIAAAAESAKSRKLDGKWVLTLQNTSGQPALASLKNRALRERLYKASINRGRSGGEFDNRALVAHIAQFRAQRAGLLGYVHHAAFALENQTARTPDAVNKMLGDLAPAAVVNLRREAADIQKLIDSQQGGFQCRAWDWAFYSEQVRKARYAFDEAEVKPYFELNRVLQDGAFYAAGKLYGLSFRERRDLPLYHPDVRVFEVFEQDGRALGLFLFDPYARDSKRGGAWANAYVSQAGLFGTQPVIANNLNIPKPPAGEPTLLTFAEANTLFHEFGHALHGLFSNVRYPLFAGTAVPRDFVEFPSQVNEMWTLWPQVLANYAKHYQTGEPMPQALADKIIAAEKFNQGFTTTEYLAAALLDQAWHQLPPDAPLHDADAFENAALEQAGVSLEIVAPRYRSTYFSHVFAGGYSAGYYAYIWSEVLDADTVEWFKQHGGLQRDNGQRFRERLLSKGGSVDAMTLYRDFRGHDPEIAPLLLRRGLTVKK